MKKVVISVAILASLILGGSILLNSLDGSKTGTTDNSTTSEKSGNSSKSTNTQSSISSQDNAATATSFSAADVATHDNTNDCWIIVAGNVYNVTDFASSHPGGTEKILTNCGKDATTAFETQGGEGSHSDDARKELASHKIGTLAE